MGGLLLLLVASGAVSAAKGDEIEPEQQSLPYHPDAIPLSQYKHSSDSLVGLGSLKYKQIKDYYLAIYASTTTGSYYSEASSLCDVVRKYFDKNHIHCVVLRSGGGGDNVRRMRDGRVQVAIVPSSLTYRASTGQAPIPGARSVMSLGDEISVLISRQQANIQSVEDLRAKRINLGATESAGHALFLDYLAASGIATKELDRLDSFPIEYGAQGVCSNYVDAYPIFTVHPTPVVKDAADRCGARISGLSGPGMEQILRQHPEYSRVVLPAGTYPGQDQPFETIGAKNVVVAYQPADPYVVYWLVKAAIENIDLLRSSSPALKNLDPHEMFAVGNYLPFHPGAERYWREIGLLGPRED
ncbi:TAXI family TRAP transporter solute-binding subunit [Telmatospirillum sp.]|uniref:TAXI family TRAP transporter solute-binding subunit n=1 Tax=Telmatospirillum sp. TaxID=2079197 RepID=UPI00283CCC74|nr:TAXI family TRAP transporter solute-binding subunit [Telmatospirillum sp.]MDR3436284.1 TAXI family TRAP transporter solute-binding subunit [Telmatospirillum sp.]